MTRAAPLDRVLAHVTAANRPNTHGAILVREIERLRGEVGKLRSVLGQHDCCCGSQSCAEGEPPECAEWRHVNPTKEINDV